MDKKIEKKRFSKKQGAYFLGLVGIVTLAFFGFKSIGEKSFKINRDRITTKKVISDDFQDIILVEAVVEPINSVLVNAPEGGTVENVYVEDGIMVKKGTPLLKLNNPAAMLNYMSQETAIVEQINNLRSLKLSLEKDQRSLTESLIDIDHELGVKERSFKVDTLLFDKGFVAKNEYVETREEYNYQKRKRDFLEGNVSKSKTDNVLQIQRINQSIEMMTRNMEAIHASMEKMLVKAPVTGRLSSFDPVIGGSFSARQTIAKIDVMSGYKVKAQVDEYYLNSIKPGLSAQFHFDGKLYDLVVKKVLPEVIGGRFEVELVFADKTPEGLRTGLSLQVRLELSQARQAVMIPRGSYFHSLGGQYVFVLNENNEAIKRKIRIGRQNPSHYEVLEGLDAGEEFISSSYDTYKDFEKIYVMRSGAPQ